MAATAAAVLAAEATAAVTAAEAPAAAAAATAAEAPAAAAAATEAVPVVATAAEVPAVVVTAEVPAEARAEAEEGSSLPGPVATNRLKDQGQQKLAGVIRIRFNFLQWFCCSSNSRTDFKTVKISS